MVHRVLHPASGRLPFCERKPSKTSFKSENLKYSQLYQLSNDKQQTVHGDIQQAIYLEKHGQSHDWTHGFADILQLLFHVVSVLQSATWGVAPVVRVEHAAAV